MAERKNQTMLNGALILMITTMLVKVIGMLYKIPLTNLIGGTGMGYFYSAYNIYTPIYAISMAGLPVAVSRLVSENVALGHFRDARMIYKVAARIFVITGIAGTLLILLLAYPYSNWIVDKPNTLPSIMCVAPSIFFCCAMSSYRGYYEGLRNMTPTGVSQFIEALGKLFLGLAFSYFVMKTGESQYETYGTVFGKVAENAAQAQSLIYPYAAAAAISGVTAGTVFGLIYLILHHKIKGDGFTRAELVNSPRAMSGNATARKIVTVAIPMVVSSLILNFTNFIDAVTIQARLSHILENDIGILKTLFDWSLRVSQTLDEDIATYLYGAYNSVLDFRNLIPTITMSLGVSAIPAISAAWATRNKRVTKITVESVLRITMLIALPAGFGMGVLSKPIYTLIYGNNNPDLVPIAAPILMAYGFAMFIMSASTPITSMLQGIGRTDIPVKALVIGAVVKLTSNYIFVGNPDINIKGACIGSIAFYVVVVSINLISLLRITRVKVNVVSVFFKPLLCASLCAGGAWSVYSLFAKVISSNTVNTVLAIGVAGCIYLASILIFKGISKDDVDMLPKGEKIAKVLEKYRFLG